jgi:mRNA interferase YafQ
VRLTDSQFEKFITYTNSLKSNGNLQPEARDHQLKGNFKDYREFHLGGDMLIIYLVQNNIITLIRIGTHSQLFN